MATVLASATGGTGGGGGPHKRQSGGLCDGYDSSDATSDDEVEEAAKSVGKKMPTRCAKCRGCNKPCDACRKQSNREASRRFREKNKRTAALAKRLQAKVTKHKSETSTHSEFMRHMSSVIFLCQNLFTSISQQAIARTSTDVPVAAFPLPLDQMTADSSLSYSNTATSGPPNGMGHDLPQTTTVWRRHDALTGPQASTSSSAYTSCQASGNGLQVGGQSCASTPTTSYNAADPSGSNVYPAMQPTCFSEVICQQPVDTGVGSIVEWLHEQESSGPRPHIDCNVTWADVQELLRDEQNARDVSHQSVALNAAYAMQDARNLYATDAGFDDDAQQATVTSTLLTRTCPASSNTYADMHSSSSQEGPNRFTVDQPMTSTDDWTLEALVPSTDMDWDVDWPDVEEYLGDAHR